MPTVDKEQLQKPHSSLSQLTGEFINADFLSNSSICPACISLTMLVAFLSPTLYHDLLRLYGVNDYSFDILIYDLLSSSFLQYVNSV